MHVCTYNKSYQYGASSVHLVSFYLAQVCCEISIYHRVNSPHSITVKRYSKYPPRESWCSLARLIDGVTVLGCRGKLSLKIQKIKNGSEVVFEDMAANSYEDCYDNSWHIIPPDYVNLDDDYRFS